MQYDHYCVYPDLAPMKEKLQEMIIAKWEEVHPFVGVESYVVDFGYLPQCDSMTLIEISPFLDCTGTALFKWHIDRHCIPATHSLMSFQLTVPEQRSAEQWASCVSSA